jgi:hypothetical protein
VVDCKEQMVLMTLIKSHLALLFGVSKINYFERYLSRMLIHFAYFDLISN